MKSFFDFLTSKLVLAILLMLALSVIAFQHFSRPTPPVVPVAITKDNPTAEDRANGITKTKSPDCHRKTQEECDFWKPGAVVEVPPIKPAKKPDMRTNF
jgi:hypothetical protein